MLQNELLETIEGDYRAFSKLVPGTRRHVDELWTDELANPSGLTLRPTWGPNHLWTADGAIYFMRYGKPYFALTRENQNPLLNNIAETIDQLRIGNYHVSPTDFEYALDDSATEVFDYDKLNLQHSCSDYPSFLNLLIDPNGLQSVRFNNLGSTWSKKISPLEGDSRRLVERVYGKGDNFKKVMAMPGSGYHQRISLLNPEYVRKQTFAGTVGGAIGLASMLTANGYSCHEDTLNSSRSLRGVVASEPAGESNSDRVKKRGRSSVFTGMEGGELSVISENVAGLTVTSEEPVEEKRSYWQRLLQR